MTFDPAFIFYRDARDVAAWETLEDMAAEAGAELAARKRLYPGMVAKGRMAQADANREIRVMAAIADALALRRNPITDATWAERVHCLRREIAMRRQLYPGWILQGSIDADTAARKLRMMESIHDMTWHGTWTDDAVAGREQTERAAA